jgi:methylglutaconyl-CoA hydratase
MTLVDYSVKDRIGFITLNRPEKRNALSHELVGELKQAFDEAEADPNVKVVLLKATGEAFCAGADLAYLDKLQSFSRRQNLDDSNHLRSLFQKIYTLKKVVVAQVQGPALAGGCGLVTVCDFVFAIPEAKLGYTEVKIGFVPAMVMVFLIRRIGEQKAKHLLLSGELVSGDRAVAFGLVNQIIPKESIETTVLEFVLKLIKNNSAQSMELTKKMIEEVQSMKLEEALDYAAEQNAYARTTDDFKKGIKAFLSKEELNW